MYAEPASVPIGGSVQPLDAPIDASPSAFKNPGIPRPPKQSSAELEMAIVGKSIVSYLGHFTHSISFRAMKKIVP